MLTRLIQSDSLVFLYDGLEKACLLEIKKAVIVDHNYVVDNDCFYAYNRVLLFRFKQIFDTANAPH